LSNQRFLFTSEKWISWLKEAEIAIGMDGKGRWRENVVIERFWRSIKYADIYLKSYSIPIEFHKGIE